MSHFVGWCAACSAPIWDETADVQKNKDNHIQNFHLGRYNAGYTVGNHVLRIRSRVAVKLNLRPYIRRYTSPNAIFEYSYPLNVITMCERQRVKSRSILYRNEYGLGWFMVYFRVRVCTRVPVSSEGSGENVWLYMLVWALVSHPCNKYQALMYTF